MNNGLIICPICITQQILGSIDINGAFHVVRYKAKITGVTTIISNPMTVICQCGFGTTINQQSYVYDATPAQA